MAYETKVLLIALAKIADKTDDVNELRQAIRDMANAEGVVIPEIKHSPKEEV